jgi:hypothetical protein
MTGVRSYGSSGLLDPAGFSKKGDEAGFRNHRAAEIKHGKVAMMAVLGGVAQHCVKFAPLRFSTIGWL